MTNHERTLIVCSITIGVVLSVALPAFIDSRSKNENSATPPQPTVYKHSVLGEECKKAALYYSNLIKKSKSDTSRLSAEIDSNVRRTRDSIESTTSYGVNDLSNAKNQYYQSYTEGYISRSEYDAKIAQIDDVSRDTYTEPKNEMIQELNRIEAEAHRNLDKLEVQTTEYENKADKLERCVEVAKAKKAFSNLEISELQAIIIDTY